MHGRKIEWEPKDGHCLLHSLSDSMWNEFQEFYNVELLKKSNICRNPRKQ